MTPGRRRGKEQNATPTEYFDNFYFSFGSEDSTLPDVVKRIDSSRLMIGSDYPHPDGVTEYHLDAKGTQRSR